MEPKARKARPGGGTGPYLHTAFLPKEIWGCHRMKTEERIFPVYAERNLRYNKKLDKRGESDEQNRQKAQPTNKANGNQKSLGHLKGAKAIAR